MSADIEKSLQAIVAAVHDDHLLARDRNVQQVATFGELLFAPNAEPLPVEQPLHFDAEDLVAVIEPGRERRLHFRGADALLFGDHEVVLGKPSGAGWHTRGREEIAGP